MASALVIGGTGFVGRHVVSDLVAHDYDVAALSRGRTGFSFAPESGVEHVTGDRRDGSVLEAAADRVDPTVVVDCAGFHPGDVRTATEVFADVDAYVYLSSGAVYARQEIPKREDGTPLRECSATAAVDESMRTYGSRKAECDRVARDAAAQGVAATTVRSSLVYGPQSVDVGTASEPLASPSWADADAELLTHHDYWIDRVASHDRVLVPGDGTAVWHRSYVEDVASALRVVAERGEPGEAYNVADQRVCTLEDVVDLIAASLDADPDVVHASRRELAGFDLDPNDFVLYHHQRTEYPHVLDTCKLAALGWTSTPVQRAMDRTVAESTASDRVGRAHDPGRDRTERAIDALTA